MRRVLMIGLTPPLEGGSERVIYETSSRIRGLDVLTQKGSRCKNRIELRIIKKPAIVRNISFLLSSLIYSIYLMLTLRKRYDIIHIHENLLYFLAPLLSIRYKVIITVHGIKGFKFYDNKILWLFFSNSLKSADTIIAVNKEDKTRLDRVFDNVVYIPNGVDMSAYYVRKPKPEKKISFIGRVHEQKGVVYLIEAFERLSKKYPDYSLEIIGDDSGEYAQELKRRFPDSRIVWRGFIDNKKEIARLLMSSYCIVLPSLWEGLPLTLFESLASARPVMVSDIPAFRSVIKDEALFFKAKNAADVAKRIEFLMVNKAKAQSYGKKGAELAKRYDWVKIAEELEEVYSQDER